MFVHQISDKGLICKIYKEHLQFKSKTNNKTIKKMVRQAT